MSNYNFQPLQNVMNNWARELPDEPNFTFDVGNHCPSQYKQVIAECINNGWLKPVAYMHEREVLISGLAQ